MAHTKFDQYLAVLAKNGGSDLYLSTGAPPCAKFHGKLTVIDKQSLGPGDVKEIACAVMDEEQRHQFEHELEMNLAYSIPRIGRFRVNIFKQRNEVSIVARTIVTEIPSAESLCRPANPKGTTKE